MNSKIKLSYNQAEALEVIRKNIGNEEFIKGKVIRGGWKLEKNQFLNDMNLDELINALYIGYEVEKVFKVGDDVTYSLREGVYEIYQIPQVGWANLRDLENHTIAHVPFGYIIHATSEEIKAEQERRVWAGIGRKYCELKDGDKYTTTFDVNRTIDGNSSKDLFIQMYNSGEVEKFHPIESAIDFSVIEKEK